MTAEWGRTDEERNVLYKQAREESLRIGDAQYCRRQRMKDAAELEKQRYHDHLCSAYAKRDQRWKSRLAGNPLQVDQLAFNDRLEKVNQRRARSEARAKRQDTVAWSERREQTIRRAMAEGMDEELAELREEKRHLVDVEQQLRALHTVERSDRTVKPIRCVKHLHRAYFTNGRFVPPQTLTPKRSASLPALGPPPWRQKRNPVSNKTEAPQVDISTSTGKLPSAPQDDSFFLPAAEMSSHCEERRRPGSTPSLPPQPPTPNRWATPETTPEFQKQREQWVLERQETREQWRQEYCPEEEV